jgi:hypothetical protein
MEDSPLCWVGPSQEELIRAIPALLSIRIGFELSANTPLMMFHGFLQDEKSHLKDTDDLADAQDGSRADNWVVPST